MNKTEILSNFPLSVPFLQSILLYGFKLNILIQNGCGKWIIPIKYYVDMKELLYCLVKNGEEELFRKQVEHLLHMFGAEDVKKMIKDANLSTQLILKKCLNLSKFCYEHCSDIFVYLPRPNSNMKIAARFSSREMVKWFIEIGLQPYIKVFPIYFYRGDWDMLEWLWINSLKICLREGARKGCLLDLFNLSIISVFKFDKLLSWLENKGYEFRVFSFEYQLIKFIQTVKNNKPVADLMYERVVKRCATITTIVQSISELTERNDFKIIYLYIVRKETGERFEQFKNGICNLGPPYSIWIDPLKEVKLQIKSD